MNDYNFEHDLHAVIERRAERIPALSDDFAQQVMSKMNARKESAKPKRTASFFTLHSSLFTRRFAAGFSIAAALLIAFLLWPESHKETTTQQEVQPVVAEADPQPVPQSIVEETKEEVMAEVQPTPQPVRKQRKAVKKHSAPIEEHVLAQAEQPILEQGKDFEPMYAQAEEFDTHYQTIRTVHLSPDVVVYVIEASDMPAATTMPSVSELRTRGLRLTNNVRQASQTTIKF